MNTDYALDDRSLDILFRQARTHRVWVDKPVSDQVLRDLYDLLKWGPTSANACPARILFLRTRASKERLAPALSPGNVEQTLAAPVTAIVAYDLKFYEKLPRLFPHNPGMRDLFDKQPDLAAPPHFATALCKAAISSLRRARWAWTAARCRGSTTRRWMPNFSRTSRQSNRTSSAISAMAIPLRSFRAGRGWSSTRLASCYRSLPAPSHGHGSASTSERF